MLAQSPSAELGSGLASHACISSWSSSYNVGPAAGGVGLVALSPRVSHAPPVLPHAPDGLRPVAAAEWVLEAVEAHQSPKTHTTLGQPPSIFVGRIPSTSPWRAGLLRYGLVSGAAASPVERPQRLGYFFAQLPLSNRAGQQLAIQRLEIHVPADAHLRHGVERHDFPFPVCIRWVAVRVPGPIC